MRYFNLFRYLVLLVGIVGSFWMTVLPTLNFTLINPAQAYIGNTSEIIFELGTSLVGLFVLASPFIFYFLKYKIISSPIVFIVGFLVSVVAVFSHVVVSGGNSTASVAYFTIFLPVQFLIVGLGLVFLKKFPAK